MVISRPLERDRCLEETGVLEIGTGKSKAARKPGAMELAVREPVTGKAETGKAETVKTGTVKTGTVEIEIVMAITSGVIQVYS
jgi:hypothetical protein